MDPRERSVPAGVAGLLKWLLLPAILLGCGAISYGLSAVLLVVADVEHVVALVNPTDRAIAVAIDGAPPIGVMPFSIHVLRPATGTHTIAIDDLGPTRSESFTITGGTSPMVGYRGVIALAETEWVLVERASGSFDAPDRTSVVRFVPAPGVMFPMPRESDVELPDLSFFPGMAPITSVWGIGDRRLCSYDPATRRVGCGLCQDASRCGGDDRSALEPFVLEADPAR